MHRPRHALSVLALVLLALLALACGLGDRFKEQAAEEVFEQALEQGGAASEVEVGVGAEVDVSDLPAWLAYPNAKATGKMTMAQDGTEGILYVLESADPQATVQEWYKAALATWQQTASLQNAEGTQLFYTDGAGQSVQVTLATDAGHTTISCWYAKSAAEVQAAEQPKAKFRPGPGGRKVLPGKGGKVHRPDR